MNRSEAKSLGLKRYFNGNPCVNGHISERLTSNGSCITCSYKRVILKYNKDLEVSRDKSRKYMASRDSKEVNFKKRVRRARRDKEHRRKKLYLRLDLFKHNRAKRLNQKTYLSSRRCKSNHIDKNGYCLRNTCDRKCRECLSKKSAEDLDAIKKSIYLSKRKRLNRYKIFSSFNRKQSKLLGKKLYRSKIKCKYEHTSKRYTCNGTCVECVMQGYNYKNKRDYDIAYREKNRDRLIEQQKERYLLNRSKILISAKIWAKNNKEKVSAIKSNYKHKRRSIENRGMSTKSFKFFVDTSDKTCFYCGIECVNDFHVDHIIPLSKGGEHERYNLCISCPTCNVRKSSLDPEVFIDRFLGGYYDSYD